MRFLLSVFLISNLVFFIGCKTTTEEEPTVASSPAKPLEEPKEEVDEEKPQSIVVPVASLGDVSETRKKILQNTLEDELKEHFMLISQERFEEAQEKAFEELDYEECTEDQCIMMIQEMLQVENVFHLEVIVEDDDTQLSLSWRTLDQKRKETDYCEKCGTKDLNSKIQNLINKLIGKINTPKINKNNISYSTEYDEFKSINIVSSFSQIGAIKDFLRLNINLRLLKNEFYQIKNKNFILQVLGYKSTVPQNIFLKIDKSNLQSMNYDELKKCAKKFNKKWFLEEFNVMRYPVHNYEQIPISECFFSKFDNDDKNTLKLIIKNLDKIIKNGFDQGKPFFDNRFSPPKEYWNIVAESEELFWENISQFSITYSQYLFTDN